MHEILVSTRAGDEKTIKAEIGLSVMEAIRSSDIDDLLALCGGCCSCATCHIYIDHLPERELREMSADEDDLLESSNHRKSNSRLSCQIPFTSALDGMRVTIAPED